MKVLPTGIKNLDEVIGGGFLKGSMILVAGNPGSGKTTFAAQFIYEGLRRGETCLYVSFLEDEAEFGRHFSSLGMDFKTYSERGLFKYLWFPLSRTSLKLVTDTILKEVTERNVQRFVLDSTTAIPYGKTKEEARAFITNLINLGLRPQTITSIFIAELPYGQRIIGSGFEEFVADAVFVLSLERYKNLSRRMLEIRKIRWTNIPVSDFEFIIGEGGIQIYLPYYTGLKGVFNPERRLEMGIKGLDEMLGGGVPEGAMVQLIGPTGSGKSVIAGEFSVHTARNGSKVLYISFEEPVEQVRYMMKNLGAGENELKRIDILSINPWAFSPGTFYAIVEGQIKKKYKLVVIDGLGALEKAVGEEGFIQLIRSIISLLKLNKITALFAGAGEDASCISTLFDIVLLLEVKRGDELETYIQILKARGIDHDRKKRRFIISRGEVIVR